MNITLTKITSSDKQYLRFSEEIWDEAGDEVVAQKVGFVQINPDKAEQLLADYQSGKRKRAFGTKDNLGNYEMIAVSSSTVNESGLVSHEA